MKKTSLLSILFILLNSLTLSASNHPDIGLSGKLELKYEDETRKSLANTNKQEIFTQTYGVKYDGNIYNPKILKYNLFGSLNQINIKQTNLTLSSPKKEKNKANNYGGNFSFLSSSKIPFKLSYSKLSSPEVENVFETNSTIATYFLNTTERYSINGLVYLGKFTFDYGVVEQKRNRVSVLSYENEVRNQYNAGLRYNSSKQNIRLSYTGMNLDNDTNNANRNNQNYVDNIFNLDYNYIINKEFIFNSELVLSQSTTDGEIQNIKNTVASGNVRLLWNPGNNMSGNLALDLSRVDYSTLINDSNSSNINDFSSITDVVSLNQGFSYGFGKGFSLSQSSSYFSLKNTSSTSSTKLFNIATQYSNNKIFSEERSLNTSAVLRGVVKQSQLISNDQNSSDDVSTQLLLDLRTAISELFPLLQSSGTAGVSYNGIMQSEQKKIGNRYNTYASLITKLWYFNNKINIEYVMSDGGEILTYGNDLRFSSSNRIGARAIIGTNAGLLYGNVISDHDTQERISADVNMNVNYIASRGLKVMSELRLHSDFVLNQLSYVSNSRMEYTIGKTFFSISYVYNYSQAKSLQNKTYNSRGVLNVLFRRSF